MTPTEEFLSWVARSPRTYAEAMDAWGSHCPRYTVWEDALAAELVHVCTDAQVRLTEKGEAALHLP